MKKILILPFLLLPSLVSSNYIESANYLAEKGIIVNQRENVEKYNLGKNILRQEIAGIIAKMSGVPEKTTCENKFLDVKITANNSWACLRIESLLDAGIISHNKKYNPESFVTKAESLGFILKGLYKSEYENFSKNNSHKSWEENAKNFAMEKGILEENFSNNSEKASRGFIFQIMKNALESQNQNPDEYRAFKWLEKNNGVYSDLASLTSGIGAVYGRESSVTAAAVTLVQSGKFSYKYKTVSSGTTVSTPSVNVGGGNSGGANSGGSRDHYNNNETGWHGYTNEDVSQIMDVRYVASVKGIVDSGRQAGLTDAQIIERASKRNSEEKMKHIIHYINTGNTNWQ